MVQKKERDLQQRVEKPAQYSRNLLRGVGSTVSMWVTVLVSFGWGYLAITVRTYRFHPDARFYLAQAFKFSGMSEQQAHDQLVAFASSYGHGMKVPSTETLFHWGLTAPRVMISLFAAPFVRVFGPYGFLVAELIISLVLTIVLTLLLQRFFGAGVAAVVMVLVNLSYYLMFFNTSVLTESMSALWSALTLIVAWQWIKRRRWWWLALVVATVALSAFTRQATLIVAGALVVAWLLGWILQRRSQWMWPAIAAVATSIACQLIQWAVYGDTSQTEQFYENTGAKTLGEMIVKIPGVAVEILVGDFRGFLHADPMLAVLICCAVAGMVMYWRRTESHLLFGAILASAVYNITNSSFTHFRYETPGLVFWMLSAGLLLRSMMHRGQLPPGLSDFEGRIVSEKKRPAREVVAQTESS
jgi:hypothetical protein